MPSRSNLANEVSADHWHGARSVI
eukprot:SAG22_NODE_15010_length_359_cov_1.280769_1_plen_23_part_01